MVYSRNDREPESLRPDEKSIDRLVGTNVLGYRILSLRALSGGAKVYVARHEELGRLVAIKVLLMPLARDPEVALRYLSAARKQGEVGAAQDAVVEVRHAGFVNGVGYVVVTDYVRGETLRDYLRRSGRAIDPRLTAEICRQIAGGVVAAHARGFANLELCPERIMLSVVRDFAPGVRARIGEFGSMTMSGSDASLQRGRAADISALGGILYECLTGRAVGGAPTMFLDYDYARVVSKAMTTDAAYGYGSMNELVQDLDKLARGARHSERGGLR